MHVMYMYLFIFRYVVVYLDGHVCMDAISGLAHDFIEIAKNDLKKPNAINAMT